MADIKSITKVSEGIYYTDDKVKDLFQTYLGMNSQDPINEKFYTDDKVKELALQSGISENYYNFDNEKGTDKVSANIEYAKLLKRTLFENSMGSKYLKFMGMYETLLTLNSRADYILNTVVIPFLPGEGVLPHTLDNVFGISYNDQVQRVEAAKDSMLAAEIGSNLGQIEGTDFKQATSPVASGERLLENLFINVTNRGASLNPNKTKLIDRLSYFNKITPSQDKFQTSQKFLEKSKDDMESFKFNTEGDLLPFASIPGIKGDINNNNDAYKEIKKYYNLAQDYDNFASPDADKNWLSMNVKTDTNRTTIGLKFPNKENLYSNKLSDYNKQSENSNDNKNFKNITKDDNADVIFGIKDDMQFPFFFEEISDSDPSWCGFPASLKLQSDSFTPEFNQGTTFIGRPEKGVTYGGTNRVLQLELTLHVQHPKYLQAYKDRINWLIQRVYPKFHQQTDSKLGTFTIYKNPPLVRMTIGDLYYRLGGYFGGITINWGPSADIWEKQIEGSRIPLTCSINLTFNVLHDFVPDGYSNFFDWSVPDQSAFSNNNIGPDTEGGF
jgi:hypothetical protein